MKPSGEGKRSKDFEGCVVKISASFSVHTPAEIWCPALSQHPLSTLHQRMPAGADSEVFPGPDLLSEAGFPLQTSVPGGPALRLPVQIRQQQLYALKQPCFQAVPTSGIFSSCWVSMFFPVTGLCLVYSQKIWSILWRVQIFFSKIFLLHNFLKQSYSKLMSSNMY